MLRRLNKRYRPGSDPWMDCTVEKVRRAWNWVDKLGETDRSVVLNDVILDQRVRGPPVDGEVAVPRWRVTPREVDGAGRAGFPESTNRMSTPG